MSALAPAGRTLGRFELRRVLGRGAQATVWLAHDPRLEREVAVKLLNDGDDAAAVGDWLHEARNVSRLTHPHIVPVFEADVQGGRPYMVFEYVPGPTLAERLRDGGAMAPRVAAQTMLGVLDALAAAHAAGLVHRDLKPSNILVDAQGRARVMDFGIAARMQDGRDDGDARTIVGTPGYMSPEAAQGAAPQPAMDVFGAGMVLIEMLSGRPLLRERDPFRALHRVVHEDMALPAELGADVDDALRSVLLRAVARDPAGRYESARAFHDALQRWLAPPAEAAAASAGGGTLDFLLRRMRHKSDFPALSESMGRIQRVANSDSESISSLANEILKDVALTKKLLRMVNTAHYAHAGGGTINTVSRAVALVGFAGIRNMALSLVLLEHMQDKSHANQLKTEFMRSLMAGAIAGELSPVPREGEEVFIGALFQNLGRLLAEYYLPEEAREVRARLDAVPAPTLGEASFAVLGVSYEDLGIGVARKWGLPEALQRCMARPAGDPPARPGERERPRWLAAAGNDVADVMLRAEPGELAASIAGVAERYAKAVGVAPREFQAAADRARERLKQITQAMNLVVPASSPARRLLEAPAAATLVAPRPADPLTAHALQATIVLDEHPTLPGRAADVLAAGIQDITNSMVSEQFRLNDVLRMIIEIMLRALGFRRVVFCLRDARGECLSGRFGLGEGAAEAAAAIRVALRGSDLFSAVCQKGMDTLIADATAPNIAGRLPDWFRQKVNAPTFLLLPLMVKNAPLALIYADKALPGSIDLGEKELSLLRTLRNQAVMAFKQAA